jgi:hypothetical protein
MSKTRSVLAALVGTIVLFLWYALVQVFPWGTGSVGNFSATSSETYASGAPGLEEAPPGTWTTEAFEDRLGGRISTLATDRSFSWIISAPREHYSIPRYFAFHALTQAGVAAFLVLVLWVLAPLPRARRLLVVGILGVAATTATYGGMLNWMGMPAAYGVGESFNLVVGWLLAFSAIDRLVRAKRTGQEA